VVVFGGSGFSVVELLLALLVEASIRVQPLGTPVGPQKLVVFVPEVARPTLPCMLPHLHQLIVPVPAISCKLEG